MEAKIYKMTDLLMNRLFRLAESVCNMCTKEKAAPEITKTYQAEQPARQSVAPTALSSIQPIAPTIRFENEDKMVEGNLFG